MTGENYNFLDSEYNKQLAAKNTEIEKKYAALKSAQQSNAPINEGQANKNLKIFDKSYDVSEKDIQNTKEAPATNVKNHAWLLDQEMAKEKETFRKALEKQMWKDWGGNRIKAKEKAFGPNDPEVKEHHQKLQKQQQAQKALEQARSAQNKSKLSQEFNKDKALQNLKEQSRLQGGKAR